MFGKLNPDQIEALLKTQLVGRIGCHADVVANGREAVEAIARAPYDLVLMDCRMPEMDGFEATDEIRASERGPRPPIIALTADVTRSVREQALAAGMDDVLLKPVSMAELRATIEAFTCAAILASAPSSTARGADR